MRLHPLIVAAFLAAISSTTLRAGWSVSQITDNDIDDDFADASAVLTNGQQYVRDQRLAWRQVHAPNNVDIMTWFQGSSSLVHSEPRGVHQLAMDWPLVVWERSSSSPADGLTAWNGGTLHEVTEGYFWSSQLSASDGRVLYSTDIGAGEASKAWVWDGSNHLLSFDPVNNSLTANIRGNFATGTVGPVVKRWGPGGETTLDGGLGSNSNPFVLENGQAMWQGGTATSSEIFYHDGSSIERLTINAVEDVQPVGDGRYIAWRVLDRPGGDLVLYDTVLETMTRLTNDDIADDSLSLAGGRLVWRRGDTASGVIMLYDAALHQTSTLSDPLLNSKTPQIDDMTAHLIAWTAFDGNDWEVFVATPEPSTALLLLAACAIRLCCRHQMV